MYRSNTEYHPYSNRLNDTSFGINNEGKKVFDYYHEDTDVVNGQKVYNGQDSTLWCKILHFSLIDCRIKLFEFNGIEYNSSSETT